MLIRFAFVIVFVFIAFFFVLLNVNLLFHFQVLINFDHLFDRLTLVPLIILLDCMVIVLNIGQLAIEMVRIGDFVDMSLTGDLELVGKNVYSVGDNRLNCLSFKILCMAYIIEFVNCSLGVATRKKLAVFALLYHNYYMNFDY